MAQSNKVVDFLRRTGASRARPFDRRVTIGLGDQGTADTIGYMRQLAIDGGRDILVRLHALEILDEYGVRGRDHRAICEAFFHWAQSKGLKERRGAGHGAGRVGLKFVNDPVQVERVEEPWITLGVTGSGDCNSVHAETLAALLLSVGVPCMFRTIAADPRRKNLFSHVYCVALVRGEPLAMDTSVNFSSPGYEVPSYKVFKKKDWEIVPGTVEEDDWSSRLSLSGITNTLAGGLSGLLGRIWS